MNKNDNASFKKFTHSKTNISSVTTRCICCYISSLVSGGYSQYFNIPCPGYVSKEERKQTKIYNLSYLPKLAHKGFVIGDNNNNNNRYRQQVEELLPENNISEWLAK